MYWLLNASERSNFNESDALVTLEKDLVWLKSKIDISYVTMHGGPIGPNKLCNARLNDVNKVLKKYNLTWTHNGQSLSFDYVWYDGGAGNNIFKKSIGDPLLAISAMSDGDRCRLLFHPQYYKSTNSTDSSHIHQINLNGIKILIRN